MRWIFAALVLASCSAPEQRGPILDPEIEQEPTAAWVTLRAPSMATVFEITLPNQPTAVQAAKLAFAVFDDVEARMNEWRPESELGRLNAAAGGAPMAVSAELFEVLAEAKQIAEKTAGLFDPTWAALWGLWDFRQGAVPKLPDPAQVQERLKLVGWQRLELDPEHKTARLRDRGMAVGLGGIAKGWALRRAGQVLRDHGVQAALLSAGGQLLAIGQGPHGPWQAGIRDPRGEGFVGQLALRDGESMATSGDYERFFVIDGVRYHHVIDLRTGYPTKNARAAITISRDPVMADALGKPLMALGAPAGIDLARNLRVAAIIIGADGQLHADRGLQGCLTATATPPNFVAP